VHLFPCLFILFLNKEMFKGKFINLDVFVVIQEIIPVHPAGNLQFVFHNPVEPLS